MLSAGKPICHLLQRDHGLLCTSSLPAVRRPRGSAVHQLLPAKEKSAAQFPQREERQKSISLPSAKSSSCAAALPVAGNQILPASSPQTLASPSDSSSTHRWVIRAHKLITRGLSAAPLSPVSYGLLPAVRGLAHPAGHARSVELQRLFGLWTGSWRRSVPPGHGQQKQFHHVMEMTLSPGIFHKSPEQGECFHLFLTQILSKIMNGEWFTALTECTIDLQQ